MESKRPYSIDTPDQQRLKVARAEIEAILRKHDIAAAVVLHTPGMTEFFYDVRPSYSCAWIDEQHQQVRFKSLATDYRGDQKAQLQDQAATANLFHGMALDLSCAAGMFIDVAQVVDRATNATHTPSEHRPEPMEGRRH